MNNEQRVTQHKVSGRVLIAMGIGLIPWLVWMFITLPRHYSAHHYRLSWTGFDLALAISLISTGRRALTHSSKLAFAAGVSTALLGVDAWFDVTQAANTNDRLLAIALAVLVELPLAIFIQRLARSRISIGD